MAESDGAQSAPNILPAGAIREAAMHPSTR